MLEQINLSAALPEVLLLIAICVFVLVEAILGKTRQLALDKFALLVIAVPAVATLFQLGDAPEAAFNGMYVADAFSHLLKLFVYVAIAATVIYARDYGRDRGLHRGEFYTLTLFAMLGQMVMISAGNLLVVYMGLELMSLSLYALAALRRDEASSTEAAIKYFILGALASGFLLYGMSMLYGGTGDLSLSGIAAAFGSVETNRTVLMLGAVFIVAGLAFKFGAVPFHMWVPDVYQGTPNSITLLIAGAPKLAAFAIAFRLLGEGLIPIAVQWQPMLIVLAVGSLIIGNIVAIAQTNFKRMIAYSTIAQIGFVMLGLMSGVVDGSASTAGQAYGASMFYIITYVLTTLGTLGIVMMMARKGFECQEINDFKGLAKRSPLLALVMLILMFSLAGIPPTVGFFAKLSVLQAAINAGHVWLAVVAVLTSLVGAFYYLRIVKVMYFDSAEDNAPINTRFDAQTVLAVNGAAVLLLGIMPNPLMNACIEAVRQALGS
ncbi:MAG: NADH-quinone oxidoreductase subunit NuoN [Burkholderiaceae bacterium]